MNKKDIVVIGASAGGIEVLLEWAGTLPPEFPGSIFIVQHLAPYYKSHLDLMLSKACPLPVVFPVDGTPIKRGQIYIAPPDHHMLLEDGLILVKKGPKENRFRPSADALFRSAAYTYGTRVVGVVLSGLLDDGTSGLWSVKRMGGTTVVQKPNEALYPSMPENVLSFVDVDHQVSIKELTSLLTQLATETAPEKINGADDDRKRMQQEIAIAAQQNAIDMGALTIGPASRLTCPECHGSLACIEEGNILRYRCHTGHAFSSSTLLTGVTKKVEEDLWNAVRGLEEAMILLEETGSQYQAIGDLNSAAHFYQKAKVIRRRSEAIRQTIFEQEQLSEAALINTAGPQALQPPNSRPGNA